MYKCVHFGIKELVSPIVYEKWGERAWMFFDEDVLRDLDTIQETYGSGIIINNWATGGNLKQCGLRSNMDELVKSKKTLYLSAHCLARGFDLHGTDNKKLYKDIETLIKNGKLKKFRRLESPQSIKYAWVHVDGLQTMYDKLEVFLG